MPKTPFDRAWTYTGLAGIVAGFGGIALAVLLAPWFSWTGNALSHLGNPARASAPFFNGGMILAGAFGVGFGLRVLAGAGRPLERLGSGVLTLGMVNLALVGVFDVTHDLHFPVAVGFFGAITYGWFLHGSGLIAGGSIRRGLGVVWLGIAHVTAWVVWAALGIEGLALPETAGAALLAVWIWDATRSLPNTGRDQSGTRG